MATLSKVRFADPKDKGKLEVLILELMSSEDSGTDGDDILFVHPLP